MAVPDTDWDAGAARQQLEREIAAHVNEVRAARVAAALADAQRGTAKEVTAAALSLLEAPPPDLWPRLAALLDKAVARAGSALDAALEGYALAPEERCEAHAELSGAARRQLVGHAREAANTALSRVKDRFAEVFQRDDKGMPRTWQPGVDIPAATAAARRAAAALLAQLAVVRLQPAEGPDAREAAAAEAAVLRLAEETTSGGGGGGGSGPAFDLLAAAEWPGLPEGSAEVLLTPAQVRSVWRQFTSDSTFAVQQALATQVGAGRGSAGWAGCDGSWDWLACRRRVPPRQRRARRRLALPPAAGGQPRSAESRAAAVGHRRHRGAGLQRVPGRAVQPALAGAAAAALSLWQDGVSGGFCE